MDSQYRFSRTEQFAFVAEQDSQQVLFAQDVFHITIFNMSNFYAFVHEEGNVPSVAAQDAPLFPLFLIIGQTTYRVGTRPYVIERLIRQDWGISVISLADNCNLRIIARF